MTGSPFSCAVASVRRGVVLEQDADAPQQLEELAATLPELFGTLDRGCLERVAARLGAEEGGADFAEVLFLSEARLHVIHPLEGRDGQALLAVSPSACSVGLVLSQVHKRAAQLKEEP